MTIIWRNIPGFSKYQASNKGFIRNTKTKYVHKNKKTSKGYSRVILIGDDGKKRIYVSTGLLHFLLYPILKIKTLLIIKTTNLQITDLKIWNG